MDYLRSTKDVWYDTKTPLLNVVRFENGDNVVYERAKEGATVSFNDSDHKLPDVFWEYGFGDVDIIFATGNVVHYSYTLSPITWGAAVFFRCIQQSEHFPCGGMLKKRQRKHWN